MRTPQERILPLPILAKQASERRELHELQPSDEELMERLRDSDSAALDTLFGRYARLVMGIALRALRDHGEAEDAVQETFLYIYRKAALFDAQKGTAKAWIVQVAFHRALDKRAYLVRRGFYSGTEIDSVGDTLMVADDSVRQADARINGAMLGVAFAELSQVQRRTLELFFFEGMDMREIADAIGETLGNVRHYYYRGLERLRENVFVKELRSERGGD